MPGSTGDDSLFSEPEQDARARRSRIASINFEKVFRRFKA